MSTSRIDSEIQTVLNRFVLFGPSHEQERETCAVDLARIAKGDELIFSGSKLIQTSTLSLIGSTFCEVVWTCYLGSSSDGGGCCGGGELQWGDAAKMLEAILLLLANCCLTDDLRMHNTLLALKDPSSSSKKTTIEEGQPTPSESDDTDNYFAKTVVTLFKHALLAQPSQRLGGDAAKKPGTPAPSKISAVTSRPSTAGGKKDDTADLVTTKSSGIAAALFAGLDLIATLSSNSAEVRALLGKAGINEAILQLMKNAPSNLELLFGATLTLSTLTTADTLNGKRLADAGGLQVLVNVNKYCFLNRAKFAAPPPKPDLCDILGRKKKDTAPAGQSTEEDVEERKEMGLNVEKYCQLTLMNMMKCPFDALDAQLKEVDYGRFGSCVAMDELKWKLSKERKRCNKILEEYRKEKKAKEMGQP